MVIPIYHIRLLAGGIMSDPDLPETLQERQTVQHWTVYQQFF